MIKTLQSSVFAAMLMFISMQMVAQVSISKDSIAPDHSAMLDVSSANQGFLPPRMTTAQRDAIQNPAVGLTIYNTDVKCLMFYSGPVNGWRCPCMSFGTISCSNPVVNGTYMVETALTASNTVTVTVNNMNTGGYNISTNTVNGFRFSKTGTFTTIGTQTIELNGTGTPTETGTTSFTVMYANSTCTFDIPVVTNQYGHPCPGLPTFTYGGKTYHTVEIGDQCWFKENINIGSRIDGSQEQTNNNVIEKYCYNNLESNCDIYGGLYQWNEMMQYLTTAGVQGICPSGWHIPSDGEWSVLADYLGGASVAGGKMKEIGYNHWQSPNTGATNESGFTCLPGGARTSNGLFFLDMGYTSYLRTSTETSATSSAIIELFNFRSDLWHYNHEKEAGFSARCLKDTCTMAPNAPASGAHSSSQTQINWIWNTTPGATGYKWNTIATYGTATDIGTATSFLETGLRCDSAYIRYVWAYNSCGNSSPVALTQSTPVCLPNCGTFTINHVAGEVAPVTKTVTYGTVTGIPGEPGKCWITSNLGADHQATAVNDATEASAGWYWQFNRKQGYKHDGTTRTPNTIWVSSISENSYWMTDNDPCALELGAGWRIPTYTEWNNVKESGNWTTWNGSWDSGLKLHAAGRLFYSDGSLNTRGSSGRYWSCIQEGDPYGWYLMFNSDYSYMTSYYKIYGFSVRCLRDDRIPTAFPTVTTSVVCNIGQSEAISGGNVTNDGGGAVTARGVCWSITQNPVITDNHTTDGTGVGTYISNLTGLIPNTTYYLRAYAINGFGTGYGDKITFATAEATYPCPGMETITINHVAGEVAPVTKTVNYGTVTKIRGETAKCWITSNLGADHQATSVDDATEASAGWYWQFNRKQGYKQDGLTVTPSWTITNIDENSDWIIANDPCSIEFGNGWRIPTVTEWANVNAGGNWTDFTGPWNSGLKIHVAGFLNISEGSIFNRGVVGIYWSSIGLQWNPGQGYDLFFDTGQQEAVSSWGKAYGCSLRCVKDCINPPSSPSSGTHTSSQSQINWNWNTVVGLPGYKWNTTDNYSTAIDVGNATSHLETGLRCDSAYTRYVWAYNSCGNSSPVALTQSTPVCLPNCGTFTINHVAGEVAPVTKTVNYGTVKGIPGEPGKCWITSNLGADQQAIAVDDATEASAGWYWQFNRKQGYKHDGSTVTPSWTMTSINENSDWQATNDPCLHELGTGWRIPTNIEWTNVSTAGNWTDWYGPWNSGLKLHAAGYIYSYNGDLYSRSWSGSYWSGSQGNASYGNGIYFYNSYIYNSYNEKAGGYSLRCLRDDRIPTAIPTVITSMASNIGQSAVSSGGNVTDDGGGAVSARGVCWSTSQNPAITDSHTTDGTGDGTFISNVSGLTPNTLYYLRAYATNGFGTGYGDEITFTTAVATYPCPGMETITINHVADSVAPVTKTATYSTVTNIPGETTKCWITSNLGADHQATSVDDATEASAGWYWQFNRKQGYKVDGQTITPSWTITTIDETSDWMTANDPCGLELGTGWHIPTYSEWNNVESSGNWTTWDGPWNAGLKLHAAGFLNNNDGSLYSRGSRGTYWSNAQGGTSWGWCLYLYSWAPWMTNDYKTNGFSARCVKDCSGPPSSPSTSTHSSAQTQINWSWNTVPGALGYKWNTSATYGTAIDIGTANRYLETGLICDSGYTRYVWAYNSCGNSSPVALTQSTPVCLPNCGTFTIKHVAGDVAPVTKTVAYGTVTGIPGEPGKCWITSNLGADHQATSVDDATEGSAGWYWQFNRKQGYKHDGSTATPSWTIITNIIENSDWITTNDPCALELGTGWHIPTFTEWNNVINSGNWTDWNGPWNSVLKLHAAGYIYYYDGSLYNRGSIGSYWSMMQSNAPYGDYLYFTNWECSRYGQDKAYGSSVRCLKDDRIPSAIPTVTTSMVSNIGQSAASSGGDVTDDGGGAISTRGVCWSTSPNPAITDNRTTDGIGDGTFVSNITGLTPGTLYYLRAYATNVLGTGYGNEITFTTVETTYPCPGMETIIINHVADSVAPVTKTVTYGTVTNIPGEPTKCWITSNLGADHQATAVDDATEASAGWYWQFNRKQGYKHDGTSRTPNMTWVSNISENSDWITSNDPCALELGAGWHIPTYTEWNNVESSGNWTTWDGPWNSGLKLHAAGYIYYFNASLSSRGSGGSYWSSTQNDDSYGWFMVFYSWSPWITIDSKAGGFSVRCVKECFAPPSSPSSGSHTSSQTQINWSWNSVPGATGYKWGITNNYVDATDMGTATTTTETGLTCNTAYTRHAWAYNVCGNSSRVLLERTTLSCPVTCNSSITVNHMTGLVAPVDKTVTYGIVRDIPGEPDKCWITSNLGATHQATAVNDTTEASAGWYWQFNRKQGYKNDGSTVTPSWTITSISETSDWVAANDPCTIELGANWRIPTSTDWTNVDASGNWNDWNGPWNSALKIHAAGYLYGRDGSQSSRGSDGFYWSSSQLNATLCWYLNFNNSNSNMGGNEKAFGFSVRCVRDN